RGARGCRWIGKGTAGSWCPGEDSNLHGSLHWYLKPARLPIPPPGQGWESRPGSRTRRAIYRWYSGVSTKRQVDEVNQENNQESTEERRARGALPIAGRRGPRGEYIA